MAELELAKKYENTKSLKEFQKCSIDVEITDLPSNYWDVKINTDSILYYKKSKMDKTDLETVEMLLSWGKFNRESLEKSFNEIKEFIASINNKTISELILRDDLYLCGKHYPFMLMFGEIFVETEKYALSIGKNDERDYYDVFSHIHTTQGGREGNFMVDAFMGGDKQATKDLAGQIITGKILRTLGGAPYRVLQYILDTTV